MICPKCGVEMNDDQAVCPECGEVLNNESTAAEEISDINAETEETAPEETVIEQESGETREDAGNDTPEDAVAEEGSWQEDEGTALSGNIDPSVAEIYSDDENEVSEYNAVPNAGNSKKSYMYVVVGVLAVALIAFLVYYLFFMRPQGISKAYYDKSITLMNKAKNSVDTIKKETAELKDATTQQSKTMTEINTEIQTYGDELEASTLTQQEKFLGNIVLTVSSTYLNYATFQSLLEGPEEAIVQKTGIASKADLQLYVDALKVPLDEASATLKQTKTMGDLQKLYGKLSYNFMKVSEVQKMITEKNQQPVQPVPTTVPTAAPTAKAKVTAKR